jgi:hypothetical protein
MGLSLLFCLPNQACEKNINGTKWHIIKFPKLYLLKRQNWLQKKYYVHKIK